MIKQKATPFLLLMFLRSKRAELFLFTVFLHNLPKEGMSMVLDTTIQTVLWIGTALMTIGLFVFIYLTYTNSEEKRHFYY